MELDSESPPSAGRYAVVGWGYGIVLWAGAAGIVMPIWLNLVGIPTSIPFLTLPSLLGHAIWGVALGALYGYLVRCTSRPSPGFETNRTSTVRLFRYHPRR